jgi:hypothetical protein
VRAPSRRAGAPGASSLPIASGNSSDPRARGGRRPRTRTAAPPRQAPGTPAVRPQSSATPHLSPASCPTLRTRSASSSSQRCRSSGSRLSGAEQGSVHLLVAHDEQPTWPRDRGGCKRRNRRLAAPMRPSHWAPTAVSPAERRIETAVQPLDPASRSTRCRAQPDRLRILHRASRSSSHAARRRPGRGRRAELRQAARLAEPHLRPHPERLRGRRHRPQERPPPGWRRAAGTLEGGCLRKAAFKANPGMERQAIMGTYVHTNTRSPSSRNQKVKSACARGLPGTAAPHRPAAQPPEQDARNELGLPKAPEPERWKRVE